VSVSLAPLSCAVRQKPRIGFLIYRSYGGQEYILKFTQEALGSELYDALLWSRYFLSSYIVGFSVSINFIGFAAVSHRFENILGTLSKPIRYMASYTFVLYLMHSSA
jgi:hypothetical protein